MYTFVSELNDFYTMLHNVKLYINAQQTQEGTYVMLKYMACLMFLKF